MLFLGMSKLVDHVIFGHVKRRQPHYFCAPKKCWTPHFFILAKTLLPDQLPDWLATWLACWLPGWLAKVRPMCSTSWFCNLAIANGYGWIAIFAQALNYICPDNVHHNLICRCVLSMCALKLASFSLTECDKTHAMLIFEAYLFLVYTAGSISSRLVKLSNNKLESAYY